jgi:very-short-patch-repair endonuclease
MTGPQLLGKLCDTRVRLLGSMRHTDIDHHIDALAARQLGAFSRKQAFDIGASEQFVYRRLRSKHWIRPAPGVYALASSPGTWLRQCKIAELSVDGSAVAGFAAAVLHEIPGYRSGHIELVASANASRTHPFATVHRYAGVKTTTVKGIRTTTYAQTVCDIAPRTSLWRLERSIDHGLVGGQATIDDFVERIEFYEFSRREGLPRIRPLIEERTADGYVPPESELEALLGDLLARMPGVRLQRQARFPWRQDLPNRVDFLLPDHRLIVEADGRRWHTRVANFDNDRLRDNVALANGYRTMRFTWTHLHAGFDESLSLVRQTIDRAA